MVEQDRGNLPTVSVIVPVYNAEKNIGKPFVKNFSDLWSYACWLIAKIIPAKTIMQLLKPEMDAR